MMPEAKKRIKKLPCPICNTVIDLPGYINSSDYTGQIICPVKNCNSVLNVTMKNDKVVKLVIDEGASKLVNEKRTSIGGHNLLKHLNKVLDKQ
jgi:C4-type Zn-finger protein